MYRCGDMIVYGGTGVCRVDGVTTPEFSTEKDKLYYVLSPLYQDGVIYTPVDTKVYMRPVISAEEAEKLIDSIPQIEAKAYYNDRLHALAAYYEEAIRSHDCRSLLELSMSLYLKKCDMESKKKKLGQIDARFMKRAEELLFGELSVALGIEKDRVADYIACRIDGGVGKKA